MALIKKVSCCLINIQSVGNKTNKIKCAIDKLSLDICILTETWLNNNFSDSLKIKEMILKSHNFYHIPGENGKVKLVFLQVNHSQKCKQ